MTLLPARRIALLLVALACLTLAVSPAFAQNITGSLSGTVVDPTGAVVVGADVTLTNEASRDVRRTKSNADGYFAFAAVPPGSYSVAIETPGFSKYEQRAVTLKIGDSRSLRTVPLKVAGMTEEATVTASIDFAPLNSGEKSATLTSEQILNFSTVGRSAAELLKVLPGMTPVTQGVSNRPGFTGEVIGINGNGEYQGGGGNNQSAIGNYSGNGTRTEALDITGDGAPGADPGCNCATSVNPNPEMVQQFKVLQSNFGAEHAKGPVAMSLVSKQGGRGFPGGIIPTSQINPGGRALLNLFPQPNANPAVTGGYNYVDNLLVDQNGTQLLGRVDFNVSENTKLFLRYNRQREVQPFVIGLWWRNRESQVPYPSSISAKNRSDSATASLTHVFNPTLTNETLFAVTYIDFPNAFDDRSKISRQALGYPYKGVFGQSPDQIPSVDAGGWGNNGPIYFNPGGFDPVLFATKWQVSASDNLTKVWGTHTFKAGVYYEHVINTQPGSGFSNGLIGRATWDGSSTGNTFADLLQGHGSQYQETSKNVLHDMAYNLWEGYVQDSWKVKPRLTIDYGVRIASEGPWYDRQGIGMAVFDPSIYSPTASASTFPGVTWATKNSPNPLSGAQKPPVYFTPRVGFAYDVKGT